MRWSKVLGLNGMALALVLVVGAIGAGDVGDDQMIRVGLRYGGGAPESVVVSGVGEWRASSCQGQFEAELRIAEGRGGLLLDVARGSAEVGPWIELWPTGKDSWLVLEGRAYRGRLRVELQGNGRLKVVNEVGLEDYVRGVVANEMFADGEAFKVQAVISRTLGVYEREVEKKHARDGFDICATGHCQVYGGVDSERAAVDEAVEATRGEVLMYEGRPIFSAYHSNGGGMTQTVNEAWPGSLRREFRYLVPVESPYDVMAWELPGFEWCYRWRLRVRGDDIRRQLKARGRDVGEVEGLVVKGHTSTGRVRELEVVGREGRTTVRVPEEVRAVLGTPSPRFEIESVDGGFLLSGWGMGHGVGLSQHGALGMARAGYGYEEILGYYYRGIELTEDYGRGEARALAAPELKVKMADVAPVEVPAGGS